MFSFLIKIETYNHELEERYQQLKKDFFLSTEHFMGGKGLADDMMLRLIDEEAFSLESLFSIISTLYKNKEHTIKNGGIYKNQKHLTDIMLKPHHSYPCLDKSLKFTIRQYGTDEWNDVAYFMPYMKIDNAWKIIDESTKESKDANE